MKLENVLKVIINDIEVSLTNLKTLFLSDNHLRLSIDEGVKSFVTFCEIILTLSGLDLLAWTCWQRYFQYILYLLRVYVTAFFGCLVKEVG